MTIDFPGTPSENDTYSFEGRTYQWDGSKWVLVSGGGSGGGFGDITALPEKTEPVDEDLLVVGDSEDDHELKKMQRGNLLADMVASDDVTNITVLTTTEYSALSPPDDGALYFVFPG